MYSALLERMNRQETLILDGGTGTDIQRRGAPMHGDTWCAEVNLTHPEIVRDVHLAYIEAGAAMITANTFATSPLLFNALERDAEMLAIDAAAIKIAREAAAGKVAVAGSISTMRPVPKGQDRNHHAMEWPEEKARELFRLKAEGLAKAGADFLLMEMMRDVDYALFATEAALATGLPVWVGISTEKGPDGNLHGWSRPDCSFEEIVRKLAALKPQAMLVMHTSPNDIDAALDILRRHWNGPLGVYPESGYFKMPDWQFVDIISPGDLVEKSRGWQSRGASLFGGCCGIGPEHIHALSKAFA